MLQTRVRTTTTRPQTETTMTFDSDLFDAYVRGELPADERARLDERLTADRADGGTLAREWDAHAEAELALARQAVRGRVAAAGRRYAATHDGVPRAEREAVVRPLWRRSGWAAAATALLLVVSGAYLLFGGGAEEARTPEALAAAYFEPAIGLPTLLGPAEDLRFEDGMVDYKQGDFAAAVAKWRPLVGEDIDQDTLRYYLGVAALGAGDAESALTHLGRVGSAADLQGEASWFEGLAWLRLGDIERARAVLAPIAAGGGRRAAAADRLLGAMD